MTGVFALYLSHLRIYLIVVPRKLQCVCSYQDPSDLHIPMVSSLDQDLGCHGEGDVTSFSAQIFTITCGINP